MGTNDLGAKKINGTQTKRDEFKGKNISLDKELVIDSKGEKKIVERVRNKNGNVNEKKYQINLDNPNANRGVKTEEETNKTVENKDHNSDITANRYPNSHPDNHEDRGNMKLDEKE